LVRYGKGGPIWNSSNLGKTKGGVRVISQPLSGVSPTHWYGREVAVLII